jgi:ribosomal protein S21
VKRMRKNTRTTHKILDTCITVRAEDNYDNPERMIRKFRKLVKNAGIMEELRERSYHKPKSEHRRERKRDKQRLIDKVNRIREELFKPRDRTKFRKRKRRN